jgi:hypothetical protein
MDRPLASAVEAAATVRLLTMPSTTLASRTRPRPRLVRTRPLSPPASFSHRSPHHRPDAPETVVEFGAGDGAPVISALLKTPYDGACTAFELNASAAQVARSRAQQFGLGSRCGCAAREAPRPLRSGRGRPACRQLLPCLVGWKYSRAREPSSRPRCLWPLSTPLSSVHESRPCRAS